MPKTYKKVLLKDIRFNRKKKTPAGVISIDGYGEVDVDHDFIYNTDIMSGQKALTKANDIDNELKRNPDFSKYPSRFIHAVWDLVQIKGPARLKQELDEKFYRVNKAGANIPEFVQPKYTEQIREFANPGTIAYIDDSTLDNIVQKNMFNNELKLFRQKLAEAFPKKKKPAISKMFNALNRFAFSRQWSNAFFDSATKDIPDEMIEDRHRIQSIYDELKNKPGHKLNFNKTELEMTLDSFNPIRPIRPLCYDEVKNSKWCFLDIEVPWFKRKNAEISWVGINYVEGNSLRREMHTLSTVGEKYFKGYRIIKHNSEKELIEAVQNSILKEDPYYVSAYNARYDLINLRDMMREQDGDFAIGDEESAPVFEATQKLFERIGIKGRMVIDPFKWAKVAYEYLPNQKLEMIARHVLGKDAFRKEITYDEMEKLEDIARKGTNKKSRKAARKIASYLSKDVNMLPKIFWSEEFQNYLQFSAEIARDFHVPLNWMFYSANSINLAQRRSFFHATGIHRDNVYRMNQTAIKARRAAKQKFRELLEEKVNQQAESAGIYHDVAKAAITHGEQFGKYVRRNFRKGDRLYKRTARTDYEKFVKNKFQNALAEWMITDFCAMQLNEQYLAKTEAKLADENEIIPKTPEKIEEKERTVKELQILQSKLKSRISHQQRKIGGNYSTYYGDIHNIFVDMGADINSFAKKNNLKIIHQDADYIYFTGSREAFNNINDVPLVKVDNIDKLLLTDEKGKDRKVHYEKFDYYKGMKIADHTRGDINLFQMKTYNLFKKSILEGNYKDAFENLYKQAEMLNSMNVPIEELVWHSKESDLYKAYENGKRIMFYHPDRIKDFEKINDIKTDAETGRKYMTKTVREKEEKVYFMDMHKVDIDYELYMKKNSQKLKMLDSLIGEQQADAIRNAGILDNIDLFTEDYSADKCVRNLEKKIF